MAQNWRAVCMKGCSCKMCMTPMKWSICVVSRLSIGLVVCVLSSVWPLQDYLDAMVGVCYDGVEGMLYLCLFSTLAACAFTVMLCAIPRAWRQIACRWVCSLPAWTPSFPPPAAISMQPHVPYELASVCLSAHMCKYFTMAQIIYRKRIHLWACKVVLESPL